MPAFSPESTLLIVNPTAAAGKVGRHWARLRGAIHATLGPLPMRLTEQKGDAMRLAEEAVRQGVTTLLSLGGDGTNYEVVNGIMRTAPAPATIQLGLLPWGTAGDFRRMLSGFDTFDEALASLRTAVSTPIDLGRVQYRAPSGELRFLWFLNQASFGLGGDIDRIVNSSPKWVGGRIAFGLATLRALLTWKGCRVRLTLDGEALGEHLITNVVVANGRYAGGKMLLAPDALLDDGLFDIVILPSYPLRESLPHLGELYRGTHVQRPEVLVYRGRRLDVEVVSGHAWLDVDGEHPGSLPGSLTLHPGALRLLGVAPHVLKGGTDLA